MHEWPWRGVSKKAGFGGGTVGLIAGGLCGGPPGAIIGGAVGGFVSWGVAKLTQK